MAKPTRPLRGRFSLPVLMLFLLLLGIGGVPRPVDAAAEGFQRWFHCGMRYWTPCHRTARAPRLRAAELQATEARRPAESELSPAELSMWGTPVVGPSGAVSYQLPPQPLLDLFRQPSDETARAYLQMWKDKAGRREAAFAAMRRTSLPTATAWGRFRSSARSALRGASRSSGASPIAACSSGSSIRGRAWK